MNMAIVGGDDGLVGDCDPNKFIGAASMWGQKATLEQYERGSFGVNFLSRYYSPYVWNGDPNSVCDIRRQASKFHVSCTLPPKVTPLIKLREKCRSLLCTDANTPILGDLAQRVAFLEGELNYSEYDLSENSIRTLRSWWARFASDGQYPNDCVSWADLYLDRFLPGFNYRAYLAHISKSSSLESLLRLPLFMEPVPPAPSDFPTVVDGQILPADPELDASRSATTVDGVVGDKKDTKSSGDTKDKKKNKRGRRGRNKKGRSQDKPKSGNTTNETGDAKRTPQEPSKAQDNNAGSKLE
jgi:hypothetical protein